jgi:hypothetical protein
MIDPASGERATVEERHQHLAWLVWGLMEPSKYDDAFQKLADFERDAIQRERARTCAWQQSSDGSWSPRCQPGEWVFVDRRTGGTTLPPVCLWCGGKLVVESEEGK